MHFNNYCRDKELFQSHEPEWTQKEHDNTLPLWLKVKHFLSL